MIILPRKKEKKEFEAVDADITPMIDIVFQLIIFFMLIMSIKVVYGIAIRFPLKPPKNPPPVEKQLKPISVWVGNDDYDEGHKVKLEGYIKLNGEPIGLGASEDPNIFSREHDAGMEYLYKRIRYLVHNPSVKYDTILNITAPVNAYHGKIVEVIDQSKKAGLKGFTMNPPRYN